MRYGVVRHQIFETRLLSVLQAPLFDCVAFDPFSLRQDGLARLKYTSIEGSPEAALAHDQEANPHSRRSPERGSVTRSNRQLLINGIVALLRCKILFEEF